jgi:cell division protein ZapA (FtsZ GTPase activity inhibitor)
MKVQITVRGRRYTMRSDEPDVDLEKVARYVDARMSEVASRPGAIDEYTVAMLAAMNIASDFERFRRQVDQELEALDRELASAAVVLEASLPGAVPASEGDDEEPQP